MTQLTQPLREEHRDLLPHLTQIQAIADAVGAVPIASLRQGIDEISAFLTHQLLPHAQAEERALYPVVGKLMGAQEATATMSRDHVEIKRLAEQLEKLRSQLGNETLEVSQEHALRRVLYGLSTLVAVHFAKEEEVYLPLLDTHLSPREAKPLFETMEQAAQEARRAQDGA
jgi:iron-sulfur cluster repair protein YtfE (RIC family)